MDARRLGLWVVTTVIFAGGCEGRPLDPGGGTAATATAPPEDTSAALKALAGPNTLLVVGTHAGVAARAPGGSARYFVHGPEQLVEAAAPLQMPVCSVEPQDLVVPDAAARGDVPSAGMSLDTALAACDREDLGDMLIRLGELKTPATVVVIAGNTAITVHSTNGGINYFYDTDIIRLLHSARKLYVPVCVIAPDLLSVPMNGGESTGVSINDALARCGRQ